MGKVRLEPVVGSQSSFCWGMKDEEYMADFCLVSKRALDENEYRIFRFHFLLGADWKMCCRRLNIDRGSFFHQLYRIEQKLGQVYRELRPHALFPIDEYYAATPRAVAPIAVPEEPESEDVRGKLLRMPFRKRGMPLRPPLRKVA